MPAKDDLQNLIYHQQRRLQKLQEQQAKMGLHTPPYILIEIEDTEQEITRLQGQQHAAPTTPDAGLLTAAPRLLAQHPLDTVPALATRPKPPSKPLSGRKPTASTTPASPLPCWPGSSTCGTSPTSPCLAPTN